MTECNYQKLAKEWFSRADDDLLFAVAGFKETSIAADACFLSHQAIEKYLKGYLVANAVEPKRIHILPELLFDCVKINPEFLKLQEDCEFLNGFYNPARYPGGMDLDFDKATGGKALDVAQGIINFIKLRINESKSTSIENEDGECEKEKINK